MKSFTATTVTATAAVIAAATLGTAAYGEVVLFDLGKTGNFRSVDTPSPDGNGHYWTSVNNGNYWPNVPDITGAATTIDFGFSALGPGGTVAFDSYNGPAGATPNPLTATEIALAEAGVTAAIAPLNVGEAVVDFAVGTAVRFEIQGLDPAATYDVSFFGSRKYATSTSIYSIYSDDTFTTLVDSVSLEVNDGLGGNPQNHNDDTLATISGVAPQASNILYVEFDGVLNAFSVTKNVIPEPASLSLVALGLGAVLRRRRA